MNKKIKKIVSRFELGYIRLKRLEREWYVARDAFNLDEDDAENLEKYNNALDAYYREVRRLLRVPIQFGKPSQILEEIAGKALVLVTKCEFLEPENHEILSFLRDLVNLRGASI